MTATTIHDGNGKSQIIRRKPKRTYAGQTDPINASRDGEHTVFFSDPRAVKLVTGSINDRILTIRQGLSGEMVKEVVSDKPVIRKMFIHGLQIDKSNTSRLYRRKHLDEHQSEVISDAFKIYNRACQVFETEKLANDWLQADVPALRGRPIDLMDTAEGRRWVMDTLERIETGDFS